MNRNGVSFFLGTEEIPILVYILGTGGSLEGFTILPLVFQFGHDQ